MRISIAINVFGVTIRGVTMWHNRGLGCVVCVCVREVDDVKLGLHISYYARVRVRVKNIKNIEK